MGVDDDSRRDYQHPIEPAVLSLPIGFKRIAGLSLMSCGCSVFLVYAFYGTLLSAIQRLTAVGGLTRLYVVVQVISVF